MVKRASNKNKEKKSSEFLKKENLIVFILLLVMFCVILSFYYYLDINNYDKGKSKVLENKIDVVFDATSSVRAEVANTDTEKTKGLMHRKNLEEDAGMLFNFTSEKNRSFWMKNTLIPLDIIFIDKDKKIVDIIENMEPCLEEPCQVYESKYPAMYALEVNAGYVDKNNIRTGKTVVFREVE